ncbi:hypothetical protein [Actimicrobium antarcticum]|uniref:Uncharacterized protein n=1 Tax=Actimicrobium antarcticum TaxID=1051899 RepID=A0ABP7THH2_9BURK
MAANDVNPVLRRLNTRYDDANEKLDHHFDSAMHGEEPDPAEFFALIQKRQITQQAMDATLKLHEKAKKTVMSESH